MMRLWPCSRPSLRNGDVRLVYCPHNRTYELRYAVQSQDGDGRRLVWSAVAFDA